MRNTCLKFGAAVMAVIFFTSACFMDSQFAVFSLAVCMISGVFGCYFSYELGLFSADERCLDGDRSDRILNKDSISSINTHKYRVSVRHYGKRTFKVYSNESTEGRLMDA